MHAQKRTQNVAPGPHDGGVAPGLVGGGGVACGGDGGDEELFFGAVVGGMGWLVLCFWEGEGREDSYEYISIHCIYLSVYQTCT